MSDLIFKNTNDCSAVDIETPTEDLQYIEYMSKKVIKDFSNVKKYTVNFSENSCENETTQEIPPNYQFNPTPIACEVVSSATPGVIFGSKYTVEINGINFSLIQSVQFCVTGFSVCLPIAYTQTSENSFSYEIVGDVNLTNNPTRELKITTTSGFEYLISYDFVGQTADDSCDATIANYTVVYQVPAYLFNPTSIISLNTLVSRPILFPLLYRVEICEVDVNDVETCISYQETFYCGIECTETPICDSTTEPCNVSEEVVKVHQGIIYGLNCCKESELNIMKHYIRSVCPDELNCIK